MRKTMFILALLGATSSALAKEVRVCYADEGLYYSDTKINCSYTNKNGKTDYYKSTVEKMYKSGWTLKILDVHPHSFDGNYYGKMTSLVFEK